MIKIENNEIKSKIEEIRKLALMIKSKDDDLLDKLCEVVAWFVENGVENKIYDIIKDLPELAGDAVFYALGNAGYRLYYSRKYLDYKGVTCEDKVVVVPFAIPLVLTVPRRAIHKIPSTIKSSVNEILSKNVLIKALKLGDSVDIIMDYRLYPWNFQDWEQESKVRKYITSFVNFVSGINDLGVFIENYNIKEDLLRNGIITGDLHTLVVFLCGIIVTKLNEDYTKVLKILHRNNKNVSEMAEVSDIIQKEIINCSKEPKCIVIASTPVEFWEVPAKGFSISRSLYVTTQIEEIKNILLDHLLVEPAMKVLFEIVNEAIDMAIVEIYNKNFTTLYYKFSFIVNYKFDDSEDIFDVVNFVKEQLGITIIFYEEQNVLLN